MTAARAEDLARFLFRKISNVPARRRRARFALAARAGEAPHPTLYFVTPDHPLPAGGIRVIYRHVDILNEAGIRAFVVHHRHGFRCRWFENDTPVLSAAEVALAANDLVVLPEVDVGLAERLPPGNRYVIFNQNSHLTWRERSVSVEPFYRLANLAAVLTVSEHNAAMLAFAFDGAPIRRVRLGIDPQMFFPGDRDRPRRIAYMPRRGAGDAEQVVQILRARGSLRGWEVVALDGLMHHQVGEALRQSRIFLALTYHEGFGLPAAEAMACGNYVVGYHAYGGREFFRPEFSAAVPTGDIVGVVNAVERAIAEDDAGGSFCLERGLAASRFILSDYSPAREISDVVGTYAALLESCRRAETAVE
ncbi:MAG: glycosyltransferase [Pararhizobium sp.]